MGTPAFVSGAARGAAFANPDISSAVRFVDLSSSSYYFIETINKTGACFGACGFITYPFSQSPDKVLRLLKAMHFLIHIRIYLNIDELLPSIAALQYIRQYPALDTKEYAVYDLVNIDMILETA
jgi:hypothetical protein